MSDNSERINQLNEKLDTLLKRQEYFYREIKELRAAIDELNIAKPATEPEPEKEVHVIVAETNIIVEEHEIGPSQAEKTSAEEKKAPIFQPTFKAPAKSDIEKFIGENLINKIGILFVVIGVCFGAQYAISHQLISPLTRIILGYLVGLGLMVTAIRLKAKYENFSAVLLSGSMAIMYFITYLAYSLYQLFPQSVAFGLMFLFTIFTVIAALNYNKQVIAIIGLVGAYGVPFLLSDGSGKVLILFTYMAIINAGILVIAFKKYWKPLYYSAFAMTWLIFISWYAAGYRMHQHFRLALIFSAVFFVLFYMVILAYKLVKKEKMNAGDIILLLLNSFIFFLLGYLTLHEHTLGIQLLGLFTLGNAIVHFVLGVIIYRQKMADKNLFYLVIGMVLVFITIAIPVQLDGHWVTILWAAEAALLFWIGRSKNVLVYEILSYPLMALAIGSQMQDWALIYFPDFSAPPKKMFMPVFNIGFLSGLIVVGSFVMINIVNFTKKYTQVIKDTTLISLVNMAVSSSLVFLLYCLFRVEISVYWSHLYLLSALEIKKAGETYAETIKNHDLNSFGMVWIVNYSLLFFSLISLANIKKIKNDKLAYVNLMLNVITLLVFCTESLYLFSELREHYLTQELAKYYHIGFINIGIRYISMLFAGGTLLISYVYIRQDFVKANLKIAFEFVAYMIGLWVASSELIHWMDMAHSTQSYKLGLSILWGSYSLMLIVIGIAKNKKYMRISAIVLFGITLLKLFFYDLSELDTIAKTIVFVLLGILLLIISFLYNKYKHLIIEKNES